jgi:hypothetical protein
MFAQMDENRPTLLANGGRFLAFAAAEVIELGAARFAFFFHFRLGDARRVHRENALDTFAVADAADGEGFVQAAAFAANHDAGENLHAFLVAFDDAGMDAHAVADIKLRQITLKLFLLD